MAHGLSETPARIFAEDRFVGAAIRRFLLSGLVALLVISIPFALWARSIARDIAETDVLNLTQRLADYAISPSMADGLLRGDEQVLDQLEDRLAPWMTDEAIVRIKIWSESGTVLYSDIRGLVGATFDLEPWARELLAGGPATLSVEQQQDEENQYENDVGNLVEVYVASRLNPETPMLFEVYYDDSVVRNPQHRVVVGIIPLLLLSMAALQGAQLIPGIRLARQVQARQRERRVMLQAAVVAGERERVRLAAALHDDIIQDLAGISYVLPPRGEGQTGPDPGQVLRESIAKLRALTSELYFSTPVQARDLPSALKDLAERLQNQGIGATLEIEPSFKLDDQTAAACHRIAREAVVNIFKYAQARNVNISLASHGKNLRLTISDDGKGFDSTLDAGPGHFGLRMMSDVAEMAGGRLKVSARPGQGCAITASFPRAARG